MMTDMSKCCNSTCSCAWWCARKSVPAGEHQSYFVGDGGPFCPYFVHIEGDNVSYNLDGVREEVCTK